MNFVITKRMDNSSTQDSDILESPIQKLNEDSLISIFNYLSIKDRIKIERVSKIWKEIVKKSWTKMKILYVEPQFLGFKPFGKNHQYPKISKKMIKEVLKRCGKYINKIDCTDSFGCQLTLVAQNCPNIQSIICQEASKKGLEKLSKNIQSLSEFSIYSSV